MATDLSQRTSRRCRAGKGGGEAAPAARWEAPSAVPEPEVPDNKRWYVVKVQSGREESIRDAIEKRVKIEGLMEFFGQIITSRPL